MKRLISFALALTMPVAASANSALEDLARQSGSSTSGITKELKKVHRDLSGQASAQQLFSISKDSTTGDTYIELKAQQLEKPYLLSAEIDEGNSEGLLPATDLGTFVIAFHWNGKKLEVDRHSMTYQAKAGTPEAKALKDSLPDSILAEIPVEVDAKTQTIRFKAKSLFMHDLANLTGLIEQSGATSALGSIDGGDSRIVSLAAYPTNVEAQVRLIFTRGAGTQTALTPDPRAYAIQVHYSLSDVRGDADYKKRMNDSRIGYFTQTHVDYTNRDLQERGLPVETVIERWNLQKKDPKAAVSDVKNPIIYWIDSSVPKAYRPAITAGILAWNQAFDAIGLRNAIIVKDVDKDMTAAQRKAYNPSDASYNVVRWFFTPGGPAFAESQTRSNPSTGQIFNGSIRVSDGLLRALTQQQLDQSTSAKAPASGAKGAADLCVDFTKEAQLQLAAGITQLQAQGASAAEKTRFVNEFLTWMASHEMGHNLGLRHNFKGSEWLTPAQVGQNGYETASVMDYVAPNMKAATDPKETFFQTKVGPYDMAAIAAGYGTHAQREAALAQTATDPALAYGTDENRGTDPDVQVWDIGKGALSNAERHAEIAQKLWQSLPQAVDQARPDDGVSLRRRLIVGFSEYHQAVANLAPVIGGVRATNGTPAIGRDSYTPVPATEQQAALKFFEDQIFSDKNFKIAPSVMRKLGEENGSGLAGFNSPVDLQAQVDNLRMDALQNLYATPTLVRLDTRREIAKPGDSIGLYQVMGELRHSIWSEVERPVPTSISSDRRDLERMQLQILSQIYLKQDGDEKDAALRDLDRIQADARRALASRRIDAPTRAFLEDVRDQIAQVKSPLAASR